MKGNVTQHKNGKVFFNIQKGMIFFPKKKGEEKTCWDILRAQPLRAERSLHRVTSERAVASL